MDFSPWIIEIRKDHFAMTQPWTLVRGLMIIAFEKTQRKRKTIGVSVEEKLAVNGS